MDKTELQTLIKKTISEQLIKEALTNLDVLHDGISTSTMVGKEWYKLVNALEGIIDETKDFKSMYSAALHGPPPNTQGALINLQMIVKLLTAMKPVILGMDDIQKKDI
jgi:hypothetical protein